MKLERLLFTSLYSLLIVSAVGTMAGTYAWFTYTSRLNTQFHGTSLSNSAHLKVGVRSKKDLPEAEHYGFVQDKNNNEIYWSEKGISAESLSYFLSASGYASTSLSPVTSGSYETGGNFAVKNHPTYLANHHNTNAMPEYYIHLPVVFQAFDSHDVPYNSYGIRLSKLSLEDKDDGKLSQAIRINFKNEKEDDNFILNPNVIEDGFEYVGGVLDLDLNGYNDNEGGKDFIYGEAETVVYNDEKSEGGEVKPAAERNVFNAITESNIYGINKEQTVFKTSSYLGKESVMSHRNVATAGEDGLAYSTITIYEEGWSMSAVDAVRENIFDLNLLFELFNEKNI